MYNLVEANRSRRRFDQSKKVDMESLVELVELARLTLSGRNMQPLKYVLCTDSATCDGIFPLLGWAAYLKDWKGPAEGERPTAYVIVCLDKTLADNPGCDHGIVAQTMMLGAVERGLGGCIIATVNRAKLAEVCDIPDTLDILLVLALGVPSEAVAVEPMPGDGDVKYWHDKDGIHHVPKRSLDELIIARYPQSNE